MAGHIRPEIDWREIDTENVVHVSEERDLPGGVGTTHTLEGSTAYYFHGFVTLTGNLDISNGPVLMGSHGATDGIIYTGGGTLLTGSGGGYFTRDMSYMAPGGTMFGIDADQSTDFLAESVSYSDAAGLGTIADLGTIDGYRVPTFKGCNFEEFDAGLTFTGTPNKIFLEASPLRNLTASNVTILSFDANLDVDIVDIVNCYVKSVQGDTSVINVDASATINDIFQYRGVTHDTTVNKDQVFAGSGGVQAVGFRVDNSYPLDDSAVVGELSLDSRTTTTISTQDTYTDVAGPTSLGNESERTSSPSNGTIEYDAKKDRKVHITVSCTVEGASNETYAVAIAKNGTVEPTSEAQLEGTGNSPKYVGPSAIEDLQTGDTIDLRVKNLDGTGNIDFVKYNINYNG